MACSWGSICAAPPNMIIKKMFVGIHHGRIRRDPAISMVMRGPESTSDDLRHAIRQGVRRVLGQELLTQCLFEDLQRATGRTDRQRAPSTIKQMNLVLERAGCARLC